MIMVDSSVWIDYFTGVNSKQTEILDNTLGQQLVAIGDLILTEVLQGFRHDKDYNTAKSLFDELTLFELLGKEMALKSADNFRALRKKGITIRKTADVIIAFGRSETGIDFNASDGKPVNLFFMIIAPHNDEGNVYLPLLGSLVTILKDSKKRKALEKLETFEELLALIDGE